MIHMRNENKPLCEACAGTNSVPLAKKRSMRLFQCTDCGFIFVYPIPSWDTLASLYSYEQGYYLRFSNDLDTCRKDDARALDEALLQYGCVRGRLLEVGCADGALIHHMRGLGWDVAGIEPNQGAALLARRRGLQVMNEKLDDRLFPPSSFDVIYLGDVLEHLPSVSDALAVLRPLLRPHGLLYLKVPNPESGYATLSRIAAQLFGIPWMYSEAPYHLNEFSPRALRTLLERNGFAIQSVTFRSDGAGFLYAVGASGYFDQLKREMKKSGRRLLPCAKAFPKLAIVAAALAPMFYGGRLMDRVSGRGTGITAVSRTA
jgi:2-polyprenyl-3-methyl-5-hydroxy-6-metoxy-1,4-benzoquinol methylase